MRVALFATSVGDPHELGGPEIVERCCTGVAHARAEAANELVGHVAQRASEGDATLDAFGYELLAGRADG